MISEPVFVDRWRLLSTGKVHLGHLETVVLYLQCEPWSIRTLDEVEYTEDPVTCKRCLRPNEKGGE